MAAPVTDREWLTWVAKLMDSSAPGERQARKSLDGYRCLLDEQPTHLVPERLLRQLARDSGPSSLQFNPHCVIERTDAVPEHLRAAEQRLRGSDDAQTTTAWVEHPGGRWTPFHLSAELAEFATGVRERSAVLDKLISCSTAALHAAGILVDGFSIEYEARTWERTVEHARIRFRESGYAPVVGLIHPFHGAELRRYFRRQIRRGGVALGDGQSPRRYIAHNDPAARFFHLQLTNAVSELVGEPVKPSYVYMASYQSGAKLERHTDRAQCEFSVTFCLDYAPEPKEATPWPLYLDHALGTATVYQGLGDGLLYRGRMLPHYRGTLRAGHTSTSIFFHYVRKDFEGPLE